MSTHIPLIKAITDLARIEKLEKESFSDGSNAQKYLCEIQDHLKLVVAMLALSLMMIG